MAAEDAPLGIREVATLAGVKPRTMKARLLRRERATGDALLFRLVPGGKLYTTLGACRRVLGADFGRSMSDAERIRALEDKVRDMRRDLNAAIGRQREFQRLALGWFKSAGPKAFPMADGARSGPTVGAQIDTFRQRASPDRLGDGSGGGPRRGPA